MVNSLWKQRHTYLIDNLLHLTSGVSPRWMAKNTKSPRILLWYKLIMLCCDSKRNRPIHFLETENCCMRGMCWDNNNNRMNGSTITHLDCRIHISHRLWPPGTKDTENTAHVCSVTDSCYREESPQFPPVLIIRECKEELEMSLMIGWFGWPTRARYKNTNFEAKVLVAKVLWLSVKALYSQLSLHDELWYIDTSIRNVVVVVVG